MNKDKIMIMVTGTMISPYDENWKECYRTWIPELKKLGYNVLVAIGKPDLETQWKLDGDFIYFKAEDTKMGLYDKSIRLPIKWILEETDYEYYFRIDSDSFVAPIRFDRMMHHNFADYGKIDYMGCVHPCDGWNPHRFMRFKVQPKEGYIASGCGYMVSKDSMKIALDKMRIVEDPLDYQIDDWVLGRAMWENGVEMLHDSRILFESKHKELVRDPNGIGIPDIADPQSHLALQHYMNGHMDEAMITLGYKDRI
jgi:hypothetical protein